MDTGAEMLRAVQAGDLDRLRDLVDQQGLQELEGYPRGYYLLCKALWHCKEEIARFLLQIGAQVSCDRRDCSYVYLPLHLACIQRKIDIARYCIVNGADVNQMDDKQRTALYYSYDESIVELLLNEGASTNIKDRLGHPPLHYMLVTNQLDQKIKLRIIDVYVKYGTKITKESFLHDLLDTFYPVKQTLEEETDEIYILDSKKRKIKDSFLLKILQQQKIGRQWSQDNTALLNARSGEGEPVIHRIVKLGLIESCRELVCFAMDAESLDRKKLTCIEVAMQQQLLEAKLWQEQDQTQGEWVSTGRVIYNIAKLVIDQFILNFDCREHILLCSAADYGCIDFVKLLIGRGADVQATDRKELHFMHKALQWYIESSEFTDSNRRILSEIMNLLLANYEEAVKHYETNQVVTVKLCPRLPKIIPCLKDGMACPKVVKLLDHRADPNEANDSGLTPLAPAVKIPSYHRGTPKQGKKHDKYIKDLQARLCTISDMLLAYGANASTTLPDNKTVIHMAEDYCIHTILERIFTYDMLTESKRDSFGKTLLVDLHLTSKFDCPGLFERLLSAGLIVSSNITDELHTACIHSDASRVQCLLDHGANAISWNKYGLTPFEICWQNSDRSCLSALIARVDSDRLVGSKYRDVIDGITETALHKAFENSSIIFTKKYFFDYETNWITSPRKLSLPIVRAKKDIFKYLSLLSGYIDRPQSVPFISQTILMLRTCIELINYYEQIDLKIGMPNVIECDTFLSVAIIECTLCVIELFQLPPSQKDYCRIFWLYESPRPCLCFGCWVRTQQEINKFSKVGLFVGIDAKDYALKSKYRDRCSEEIERLKKTKINQNNSLYDYLHDSNPSAFRQFWNSECQDKDMYKLKIINKFVVYPNLIRAKIWRDSMRVELLPRAKSRLITYLNGGAPLRKVMIQNDLATKILQDLSNFELMILIGLRLSDVLVAGSTGVGEA